MSGFSRLTLYYIYLRKENEIVEKWSLLALLGTGLMSLSVSHASDQVAYPTGYQDWSHIKSMVIKPGHPLANPFQGIHHVYANAKAKRGLKSGHYEDGAIFVFDLLQYIEADKTLQESDRKLVGVMKMDKRQFAKTGGWGLKALRVTVKQNVWSVMAGSLALLVIYRKR